MHKISMRFFIRGKVQGVWFRASTKAQAEELEISGWARNLPDGRVEVFACGEKEKVKTLYEWLKHGPGQARVDEISVEELEWQDAEGFTIL